MRRNRLGRSDIEVSAICLGSMTWGSQNTEAEGHAQIDQAAAAGVNFIDTAEMYPTTPQDRATHGRTEEIIGSYLAGRRRDDWVIATKITGAGHSYIRDGAPIDGAAIRAAVDGSLSRLRTDYIDLYQLHWPNRGSYHFRQSWAYTPSTQARGIADHVTEVLGVAADLIKEGKIRALGLSNETTWGLSEWLRIARAADLPRVLSVQNEYSLLARLADLDLAELCHHEEVGFLAFSPLAAGMLSGKYRGDATPPGSRRAINGALGGRLSNVSLPVCDQYVGLARDHGLDPAEMALAFCLGRPFMTATIIGATTPAQLATDLAAAEVRLGDDILAGIAEIHRRHPIPM